jgi:hypothetical protein
MYKTDFESEIWRSFAQSAGDSEDIELLNEVWRALTENDSSVSSAQLGSFAKAAGNVTGKELLHEIWNFCRKKNIKLDPRTWGSYANAAGKVEDKELLFEIWNDCRKHGVVLEPAQWGTFADAAGKVNDGHLLNEIWKSYQDTNAELDSIAWSNFANAAGKIRKHNLVKNIWETLRLSGSSFDSAQWGSFANAARNVWEPELLEEIWKECLKADIILEPATWGSFANAAGYIGNKELLRKIWKECSDSKVSFDKIQWGSFANAAGLTGDSEILSEIWQFCRKYACEFDKIQLSTFAKAFGKTGLSDFLNEIWAISNYYGSFDSILWGTLTDAAGYANAVELLNNLWESYKKQEYFESYNVICFIRASETVKNEKLFTSVWHAIKDNEVIEYPALQRFLLDAIGSLELHEISKTFWAQLKNSHEIIPDTTFIAFMRNAAELNKPQLMEEIFNFWNSQHDPYDLPSANSFKQQCIDVAIESPNLESRTNIWKIIHGHNFNPNEIIAVLNECQILNEIYEKRFVPACKVFSQYLANQLIFDRSQFEDVSDDLKSILDDLKDTLGGMDKDKWLEAWFTIFNSAEIALQGALKEYYVNKLHQICNVDYRKWTDLTDSKKNKFTKDIYSKNGLIQRINDFINSPISLPKIPTSDDNKNIAIFVEHYVSSAHNAANSNESIDLIFFKQCMLGNSTISEIADQKDTRDKFDTLILDVFRSFTDKIVKEMENSLHHAVHDIIKKDCRILGEQPQSSENISKDAIPNLWNTINSFSIQLYNIEDGYRKKSSIDISKTVLHIFLSGIESTRIDFQLPSRILINGWHGVIKEQIEPLFNEIMINARKALVQLPEDQQQLTVKAIYMGYSVQFEISNTFDKNKINKDDLLMISNNKRLATIEENIKNLGMRSIPIRIKRRLQGLYNKEYFPEIRLDENPPVWILRFDLPTPIMRNYE